MAAEDAARRRIRAAGMVCGLWVLILGPSVLALEGKKEGGRRPPCLPVEGGMVGRGRALKRQRSVKPSKREGVGTVGDPRELFQRQAPHSSRAPAGK